jgi:hypothetical protein
MQSVPITANVVSSNPAHGEVYSMQHYVIKFVSHLLQVGDFLWVLRTEILLKVVLNTITSPPGYNSKHCNNLVVFKIKSFIIYKWPSCPDLMEVV